MGSDRQLGEEVPQLFSGQQVITHRDTLCDQLKALVREEYAYHADQISREGADYRIAGSRQINPAFHSFHFDRFLHVLRNKLGRPRKHELLHIFGKSIRIFAWILKTAAPDDRPRLVRQHRDALRLLLRTRNLTWGMSNAMAGLIALKELGTHDGTDYIDQIFGPLDWRFMRRDLHWNKHFDRRSGRLIGLPNNYYPVLAWVALGRARLGWDDTKMLELFIERSLSGFADPSGRGWFDDSGIGTYDVYHTVATYELIDLIRAYDPGKARELKPYCDNLAEEYLYMGQPDGSGFPFGRTIGVNGDMWMASGLLMVMTLGYGDCSRYEHYYRLAAAAISKAMAFWYDHERHISNKWFDGRRTDPYMTESRILDATLDLYLRWAQARDMLMSLEPVKWQRPQLPAPLGGKLFRHSESGDSQKATYVYRTSERSYSFPMVAYGRPNGQLMHYSNYMPDVRSNGVLEPPIYVERPFLNPRILCSDGISITPYANYEEIEDGEISGGHFLTWRQDRFVPLQKDADEFHDLSYRCLWFMNERVIARVDIWLPWRDIDVDSYEFEMASTANIKQDANQGFLVGNGQSRFRYLPLPGNLEIASSLLSVEEDENYRTYAGRCLYSVRSVSSRCRLLIGQLYYSGFIVDFRSSDSAESPQCRHAALIGEREVVVKFENARAPYLSVRFSTRP